jgi:hypothetical protein
MDLSEEQAETILHDAFPGIAINKQDYVYGRTQWHNQPVGVIIYPLLREDQRSLESVFNASNLLPEQKDQRINDMLPSLMAHDPGGYAVYDLNSREFIRDPEHVQAQVQAAPENPDTAFAPDPQLLQQVHPSQHGGLEQGGAFPTVPKQYTPPNPGYQYRPPYPYAKPLKPRSTVPPAANTTTSPTSSPLLPPAAQQQLAVAALPAQPYGPLPTALMASTSPAMQRGVRLLSPYPPPVLSIAGPSLAGAGVYGPMPTPWLAASFTSAFTPNHLATKLAGLPSPTVVGLT